MDTVSLIATESYAYAGRSLSKGDSFEASQKDAKLLKLVGRAKDAPAKRAYLSRALDPADAGETPDDKPKRQYRRRDLVPEP